MRSDGEERFLYLRGWVKMKKWLEEDWEFEIEVIRGTAQECRLGFEKGDKFFCQYECPTGFCPKTMPVLYTLCEIVRRLCCNHKMDKGRADPCALVCEFAAVSAG